MSEFSVYPPNEALSDLEKGFDHKRQTRDSMEFLEQIEDHFTLPVREIIDAIWKKRDIPYSQHQSPTRSNHAFRTDRFTPIEYGVPFYDRRVVLPEQDHRFVVASYANMHHAPEMHFEDVNRHATQWDIYHGELRNVEAGKTPRFVVQEKIILHYSPYDDSYDSYHFAPRLELQSPYIENDHSVTTRNDHLTGNFDIETHTQAVMSILNTFKQAAAPYLQT